MFASRPKLVVLSPESFGVRLRRLVVFVFRGRLRRIDDVCDCVKDRSTSFLAWTVVFRECSGFSARCEMRLETRVIFCPADRCGGADGVIFCPGDQLGGATSQGGRQLLRHQPPPGGRQLLRRRQLSLARETEPMAWHGHGMGNR